MIKYLFLLFILLVVGCEDKKENIPVGWQIGPIIDGKNFSSGVRLVTESFHFPMCSETNREDGPSVHYVTKRADPPLRGSMSLTYEIQASPNAVFYGADGGGAGRIALHFQRKGDDFSLDKYNRGFRWWSKTRPELKQGNFTIVTPIEVEYWTPDNGIQAFNTARDNAIRVGFTFGGSQNAGHGVCMLSGTAKFIIKEFKVE